MTQNDHGIPFQPGIWDPPPPMARFLTFDLLPDAGPAEALKRLAASLDPDTILGIGPATVGRLGANVDGLREPRAISGAGVQIPANPAALWLWLRGSDRGELVHRTHALEAVVADAFQLSDTADSFTYDTGRDLSGFQDGTENPQGGAALAAAFVAGRGPGLDGSSFVAVQRWVHDLARLASFSPQEQDAIIGRTKATDEEIVDAPDSAHIKRAAQEDFDPPAFVLRRSMPWSDPRGEGLIFVAFGHSLDAFEAQLSRMAGEEDGILDGLFRFTVPISTSHFWCPPRTAAGVDLQAIGL